MDRKTMDVLKYLVFNRTKDFVLLPFCFINSLFHYESKGLR